MLFCFSCNRGIVSGLTHVRNCNPDVHLPRRLVLCSWSARSLRPLRPCHTRSDREGDVALPDGGDRYQRRRCSLEIGDRRHGLVRTRGRHRRWLPAAVLRLCGPQDLRQARPHQFGRSRRALRLDQRCHVCNGCRNPDRSGARARRLHGRGDGSDGGPRDPQRPSAGSRTGQQGGRRAEHRRNVPRGVHQLLDSPAARRVRDRDDRRRRRVRRSHALLRSRLQGSTLYLPPRHGSDRSAQDDGCSRGHHATCGNCHCPAADQRHAGRRPRSCYRA